MFAASPVSDVYFAPDTADTVLVSTIRARRLPGGLNVHDLSGCYRQGAPRSACQADISGTPYRLVGFIPGDTEEEALRRVQKLDTLVSTAANTRRQVVLVAPRLPARPAAAAPAGAGGDSAAAPRRPAVPASVALWDSIMEEQTVVALLTGEDAGAGEGSPKVIATPALGTDLPDASLSATRSVSLVRLQGARPSPTVLRYEPTFSGQPQVPTSPRGIGGRLLGAVRWLWNLAPNTSDLARLVILAIAFLAAYLTIAALWRLQDGESARTTTTTVTTGPAAGATTTTASATIPPATTPASPNVPTLAFDNNFARTVLSGLAGLVVLTFVQSAWQGHFPQANTYYVVWFVVLFVLFLLLYALVRGGTEVLRSRLAAPHRPPAWARPAKVGRGGNVGGSYVGYSLRRFWSWLLSLRTALLVFLDTFLAIVLGRNQLHSAVWEDEIAALHGSLFDTVRRVRDNVSRAVEHELSEREDKDRTVQDLRAKHGIHSNADLFRVSISLMAHDQASVFYLATAPGNLARRFSRNSLAWVATSAGVVRWWKKGQELDVQRVLYKGPLGAEADVTALLKDFVEPRTRSDYEAFVVIPLPLERRDLAQGHRRGAIHISLRFAELFDILWPGVDPDTTSGTAGDPATGTTTITTTDRATGKVTVTTTDRATGKVTVTTTDSTTDETIVTTSDLATGAATRTGAAAEVKAERVSPAEDPFHKWELILSTGCLGRILQNAAEVLGVVIQPLNEQVLDVYIRPCRRDTGG